MTCKQNTQTNSVEHKIKRMHEYATKTKISKVEAPLGEGILVDERYNDNKKE